MSHSFLVTGPLSKLPQTDHELNTSEQEETHVKNAHPNNMVTYKDKRISRGNLLFKDKIVIPSKVPLIFSGIKNSKKIMHFLIFCGL